MSAPVDDCDGGVSINDFLAYMPTHTYIFRPTGELWPASSVNGRLPPLKIDGRPMKPSDWIDQNRPVEQMTWDPGEGKLIHGKAMQVSGWAPHAGMRVFNLYNPPRPSVGDAALAGPWLDHVRRIYPDDAEHIERWLAHRIQFPGVKCNHALVLIGDQGIGKDALLVPIRDGVGPWNWSDISPPQLTGRFNSFAKAVVLLISEARDLGTDVDRFSFYEHAKVYICGPPPVLRVDEKNLREHNVPNLVGVVITSNHKLDGLYLAPDDRRHFIASSNATRETFGANYWPDLFRWYEGGGIGHAIAYLRALDLSAFNPKAPPPRTPAFWAMVAAGEAPEAGEMRDVLDALGSPSVVTLGRVIDKAEVLLLSGLRDELVDRKQRRTLPHRFERAGYTAVRNPDAKDGLFKLGGRRTVVYARRDLPLSDQIREARRLTV
ncbi:MAG: DUF5906 domain-containing protein [Caldimonas sp.]